MDETKNSFWWKIWGRPVRSFALLMVFALFGFFVAGFIDAHRRVHENFWLTCVILFCVAVFSLALLGLILSAIPRTRPCMSWALRRWFFCTAVIMTLVALFYAEENWRGQRALDRAKQEIEARGAILDWDKYVPPAVPDAENVFKAPKMQEWFVGRNPSELTLQFQSQTNFPVWGGKRQIESETEARAYLAWSDQLQPQFTLIRDALKRSYSRMDGDYANMMTLPVPNFAAIREVARVLAQRTHCYLLVHEPDKAVAELALMHDLSHFLDCKPTGKPMTLVGAMINVAVVGLYAEVIGDGFRMHAWQEPQLVELQRQLSEVHAMIPVADAFATEPAASTRALETVSIHKVVGGFEQAGQGYGNLFRIVPRGWALQNIANETPFFYAPAEAFDTQRELVKPGMLKDNMKHLEEFVKRRSLFNILAALMIPNTTKAAQITAKNQNLVNQALLACALERYHLANGSYPDSLDALAPKFIEKVPHDIINGAPLQYRRDGDSFVLYSVGWNEKDDGGTAALTQDNKPDPDNGDWVWSYAGK